VHAPLQRLEAHHLAVAHADQLAVQHHVAPQLLAEGEERLHDFGKLARLVVAVARDQRAVPFPTKASTRMPSYFGSKVHSSPLGTVPPAEEASMGSTTGGGAAAGTACGAGVALVARLERHTRRPPRPEAISSMVRPVST
jgi:hypothetical protein